MENLTTRVYTDEEIERWAQADEVTPEFEEQLAVWLKQERSRQTTRKRKAA